MKDTFLVKTSYKSVISKLSDKQAGILFKMLFEYVENGVNEGSTDDRVDMAFEFIKIDLDHYSEAYQRKINAAKENGKKGAEFGKLGGRPRKTPKTPNPVFKTPKTPDIDIDNVNKEISSKEDTKKKISLSISKNLSFVSPKFESPFKKWLEYKSQKKQSYKSDLSIRACYEELLKLSNGDAVIAEKIVNKSIANNWAGIFRLKEDSEFSNKKFKNNSVTEYTDKIY